MSQSKIDHIYALAASKCASREMSSRQMLQWLKGVCDEENWADTITEKLVSEGFISDVRFSVAYASDKFRFNKWGRYKIRMMLQEFVSEENIDQSFSEIDDVEYRLMVENELEKKYKTLKNIILPQKKNKLYSFAQSRGYEFDLVNEFLKNKNSVE